MDPESVAFQPRDDFWRFQGEMLRVQQNQADLSERVSRLERKQDEDSRLKNVWGTSSPFPSVLGGTPQQVPLQQPTAEHFSNFDDHSSNLIGNLQLDADDEPRRIGTTSRANSVRFDETANHGHWAHASRSSLDLIPRTGSSMGGHLMSERSYSHKSDGRQSSTGHSVHSVTSGRANSLTSYGPNSSMEPPGLAPGLFILGSVPGIIRCWLNTDFKHDTLLYAAVCTGSYTSYLDLHMIERLGFQDQITMSDDGVRKIKLSVYLPEAVPVTASSRSSSPAPQLPSLSVDFTVVEDHDEDDNPKAIQIFLGSDMLRAHNADVLFSSNQIMLYDDERTKLQIPMVRPEDDRAFKSLFISHGQRNSPGSRAVEGASVLGLQGVGAPGNAASSSPSHGRPATIAAKSNGTRTGSSDDGGSSGRGSLEQQSYLDAGSHPDKEVQDSTSAPRSGSAIWGNWRREAEKPNSMDWANVGKTSGPSSGPTYQRRETGIKVLKPSKPGSRSLSTSISQPPSSASATQSRFFDDGKRRGSTAEGDFSSTASTSSKALPQLKRSISGEKAKESPAPPGLTKTRSSNPVGGASAFAWLNSGGGGPGSK